ncbi:MAG: VCBS repeat-containing protein [Planctomycetota bacterium]
MHCNSLIGASLILLGTTAMAQTPGPLPSPQIPAAQFGWQDFDGDGLLDALAISPAGQLQLLRNQGDGTFLDVTSSVGLQDLQNASFALWGDYDGDSQPDLFVGTHQGASHLLRLEGGLFVDATLGSGLEGLGADQFGRWLDYDRDGRQDLELVRDGLHTLHRNLDGVRFGTLPLPPMQAAGQISPSMPGSPEDQAPPSGAVAGQPDWTQGHGASSALSGMGPGTWALGTAGSSPTSVTLLGGANQVVANQCFLEIRDAFSGACIEASNTPTIGRLYPQSTALNVNASNSRVGMGTTNPDARLAIANIGGTDGTAMLGFGESTDSSFYFESQFAGSNTSNGMSLTTAIGGPVRIMSWWGSGRVGIKKLAPNYDLDVTGDINASGSLRVNGVALPTSPCSKHRPTCTRASPWASAPAACRKAPFGDRCEQRHRRHRSRRAPGPHPLRWFRRHRSHHRCGEQRRCTTALRAERGLRLVAPLARAQLLHHALRRTGIGHRQRAQAGDPRRCGPGGGFQTSETKPLEPGTVG